MIGPKKLIYRIGTRTYSRKIKAKATTIGTGKQCDIVLRGENIAPMHCMIDWTEDEVPFVVDLNTEHGTRLNAARIERGVLQPGDIITVGGYDIMFWAKRYMTPVHARMFEHTRTIKLKHEQLANLAEMQEDELSAVSEVYRNSVRSMTVLRQRLEEAAFAPTHPTNDPLLDEAKNCLKHAISLVHSVEEALQGVDVDSSRLETLRDYCAKTLLYEIRALLNCFFVLPIEGMRNAAHRMQEIIHELFLVLRTNEQVHQHSHSLIGIQGYAGRPFA